MQNVTFFHSIPLIGMNSNQIAAHQVGAEAVIDRLHGLARAVEMDGTVMAVGFKGGACEGSQPVKIRLSCQH